MGRSFDAYLVDWSQLELAAAGDVPFVLFDPEVEIAQDVPSSQLVQIPALVFKPQSPVFFNLKAAVDAGTQYDRLRDHLPPDSRSLLDHVFQALFWWGAEGGARQHQDLDGATEDQFLITMSPASVARYDDCAGSMPSSALSTAYIPASADARFSEDFSEACWLPSEAAYLAYIDDWFRLLREARTLAKGIVLQ
jgi:hypothetical protein